MDPPSTYTPFFRRFTNERAREIAETQALYQWVRARQDAFKETPATIGRRVYEYFDHLSDEIATEFAYALADLISAEKFLLDFPPPDIGRMSLREFVEFRNLLLAKQYFFTNQDALLQLLHEGLVRVLYGTARELPVMEDPSPFTIPLIYTLPNPRLSVEQFLGTLSNDEYISRGVFRTTADRLYKNLCAVSGRPNLESTKPLKLPTESALPLDELVDAYLDGTPFKGLMKTPVPLKLTRDDRMSHMHIVGGSGSGKTTLLENLILHDLRSPNPPSLVIIDPHSDLIRKLSHSDLGLGDRLIIIDPRDTKHPPALNVFAQNRERLASYDEATREQMTAGVIETFNYLFSGLFSMDLTGKQQTFFRFITRLMLSLPDTMGRNATILDMLQLMQDATPYLGAISKLPPIQREFFERDFLNPQNTTFRQTKEQLRYRLQSIVENPTLARLFTAPETKIDLFDELNRGSVILVDTAKDFLKGGSSTFGRIFISLVLQAVQERAAIPAHRRKDTFLIVDEAASYFDSNIDDLLTDARKYRCGCVFAHQYLDQASSSLRASLAANTGAKFVSGVSAADARAMSSELRTTPDFILSQPRLHFAAHIRNITPSAVSIPIKVGVIDRLPKLSADAYDRLIDRNRERVSRALISPPSDSAEADDQRPGPDPLPKGPSEKPGGKGPLQARPDDISSDW